MANVPIFSNEYACIDVEKPRSALSPRARLMRMAEKSGRSYLGILKEIISLKVGPGRLSFDEYAGLGLYDGALYGDADKKTFVGFKALQKIWIKANYRFDLFGIVNNKITTDILLGTYGLPILPTMMIFREQVGVASPFLIRSEDELRAFLIKREHYPMFGKPVSGHQSMGTASINHYDPVRRALVTTTGFGIPLDTFVVYVKAHSASGYLFQKRVSPHAAVREMCGERLATVRLLTVATNGLPEVMRACWKIPAGNNIADNFWRPGNLLAQLDSGSGRVIRVVRESASGIEEVTHHPDTGKCIMGMEVPNWRQVMTLALEGAKVLGELGLIGWDIAPLDSGGVIVEVNETPDFRLHQLADRQGMLTAGFKDFLKERERHAAEWLRNARKQKLITELVPAQKEPAKT